MYRNYSQLIQKLEYAIFGCPSLATGIDGWVRYGETMQTKCRPDGSVSSRPDKTVLKFRENGLFMTYNGASFKSAYVCGLLKKKYGDGWMKTVCSMYGITTEDYTAGSFIHGDNKQAHTKPMPYVIGDESEVDCIPQKLVSLTYDCNRFNTLRNYLCSQFGEAKALQVWERYRVGNAYGGQTLFWCYDRQGRCRGGKMMSYHPDGHRDKESRYGIISIGADLKRRGNIPEDLKLRDCIFGEHLVSQLPNLPVGLVESEKTALICSIRFPEAVWLATGGAKRNLDRAIALLKGRKVEVFPDADTASDWKNKFRGAKGFSVNEICRNYYRTNGEKWQKCDLADIIIEEHGK